MNKEKINEKIFVLFITSSLLISLVSIFSSIEKLLIPVFVIDFLRIILLLYLCINYVKTSDGKLIKYIIILQSILTIYIWLKCGAINNNNYKILELFFYTLFVENLIALSKKNTICKKIIINTLIPAIITFLILLAKRQNIYFNISLIKYEIAIVVIILHTITTILLVNKMIKEKESKKKITITILLEIIFALICVVINDIQYLNIFSIIYSILIYLLISRYKKNIVISSAHLDYGGIEKSLITLLKNMDCQKYDIILVLENKMGVYLKEVPKEIIIMEYKTSNLKNAKIRKIVNLVKRMKWLIFNYKRYDASVCYATYSKPSGFIARTSSNNQIFFVHSNYKKIFSNDIKKLKSFFYERYINKYKHIVFVSNESRNDLINVINNIEKKSIVINNLVDYETILKLSRKKINIDKNKKTFIFIGRLEEESKKISRILSCAKKLENENIEFWIIGDGEDKEKYLKTITQEKISNVKMLGAMKNPYPYLKQADYLLLTSLYEGYPVVYSEALVLNKPILTTIDVTDEYIDIKDGYGIIMEMDEEKITDTIKMVAKKGFKTKESPNFKEINEKRIKKIETILER